MKKEFYFISFFITIILITSFTFLGYAQDSSEYVKEGWSAHSKHDSEKVYEVTDACIKEFSQEADEQAAILSKFPSSGEEEKFRTMNDVATCYFIRGEALRYEGKINQAKKAFQVIVDKYPYAQNFDPRGWYWSLKEKSEMTLQKFETGEIIEEEEQEEVIITKVKLYDKGSEFPVNYSKYGNFENEGSKEYRYIIKDPIGLAKATGEGIYPNTTSIKFDPRYIKLKKNLHKVDHWKVLSSRDLNTAFYKWNKAPESDPIRQFNIAEILERSGLIEHAIKAYYSILVHFSKSYNWTYWHTPWYVGKTTLYRLRQLLKENPKVGLKLVGAKIDIINGYDNDIRNDVFIVNPGRLIKMSLWERIFSKKDCSKREEKLGEIVETKGGQVKLVKYASGDWQMFVNDKPFMIKGITYAPTRVGESPDDQSHQNWLEQDLDKNGLIDAPYQSWVDKNRDDKQDKNERVIGDFTLMQGMGVNAIRLYIQPFELNKEKLRQMYEGYGIYVILGDFLGKYTLGSGASWEEGTDYNNPEDKKKMLESVRKMVEEFKDEDFVLIWLLGNENIYGLGCNADKKPESFFKFANEAALLIKSLDPKNRPVAISSGDTLFLDVFAKNCPDIDIFGTNSYRGKYGFLDLWDSVKKVSGKPAMITEYGAPSYAKMYTLEESEAYQAQYHENCWLDIVCNSTGSGAGNAIGGIVFEWLDEWWKAYEPGYHDKKGLFSGPFLDGYMHEEWLGIVGQGKGTNSPYLRQLRDTYYTYQRLWSDN